MTATVSHPFVGRRKIQNFAWVFPAILVAVLVTGAIASLVGGVAAPDVIGADGLAGTFLAVP
jgi:hypothetical protein